MYNLMYTAQHDKLHTLHLDKISSEHKYRDRRYSYCLKNINSCEPVHEAPQCHLVSVSQHSNFMPVHFTYFWILIFPVRKRPYLCVFSGFRREVDAIPRVACWTSIPSSYKTPWGWHSGAETCSNLVLVMNCILLRAFVSWYMDSQNRHCRSDKIYRCKLKRIYEIH